MIELLLVSVLGPILFVKIYRTLWSFLAGII